MYEHRGLRPLFAGMTAGFLGTAAMTVAMVAMHRRLPPGQRGPLPPYHISMAAAQRVGVKRHMTQDARFATTMILHFAYGSVVGAFYVPFARLMAPGSYPFDGLAFGMLVWTGSYMGWLPVAGLISPATRHPAARNALMIVAHFVWGGVIAGTFRAFEHGKRPVAEGRRQKEAARSRAVLRT
jgi:uncharacterized membrane protein YagU involved in acid resistance